MMCSSAASTKARRGAPSGLLVVAALSWAGCAGATGEARPSVRSADRPILYVDVTEGGCGAQRDFTAAVTRDGHRVLALPEAIFAAWAPDGSRFVAVIRRGGTHVLALLRPDGEVVRELSEIKPRALLAHPVWAPNGRSLAVLGARDLNVLDDRGETIRRIPLPPGFVGYGSPEAFRWSPDGTRILVAWRKTLVATVLDGAIETVVDQHAVAEWAPTGDAVYYFLTDGRRLLDFRLHRLGAKEPVTVLGAAGVAASGLGGARGLVAGRMSLSPSGTRLAVVAASRQGAHTVRIYDTQSAVPIDLRRPVATFETRDLITGVDWSPDERHLATMAIIWEPTPTAAVRVLDLGGDRWTTLARVAVPLITPCIDLLGSKMLSWSR